jgi:hypothetical protein
MSLLEHEPIAPVTQLQELRTSTETYETFHQLYNPSELKRKGFSTLLNRVLHIDETEDRSTHFIVAQANVPQPPIRRQYDHQRAPLHYVPYNAQDIVIASTDGVSIAEYDVINAYGLYRAHLNSTDHQYDARYEKMYLTFSSDRMKQLIKAEFNVATGDGTIELGAQPCAWILSDHESAKIRDIILTPALTNTLGHTAIAS